MKAQWYVAKMNNIADQGLIADEQTGENIAVSYKKENAQLIASAPELLEALKMAVTEIQQSLNYTEGYFVTVKVVRHAERLIARVEEINNG